MTSPRHRKLIPNHHQQQRAEPTMASSPSPQDLELDRILSDDLSMTAADSPLLTPTSSPPAWMLPRVSPFRRLVNRSTRLCLAAAPLLLSRLVWVLRPRFSWRYVFLSTASVYLLACLALRRPLLAASLPEYNGPHGVGTMDLEVPLQEPRSVTPTVFRDSGEPAFELRSVLVALYYPVDRAYRSPLPRHFWCPRPVSLTARGYARFIRQDNIVFRPLFTILLRLIVGGITIPAEVDAPLLEGAAAAAARWPVVVFSHGMASSRTDYTYYLGQLASRGYIVAAVEHRDGSVPGTLIKTDNNNNSSGTPPTELLHFRESDLLLPDGTDMTTTQLKREQLAFRDAEILEAIALLRSVDRDRAGAEAVAASSSRGEGSSSLPTFASRIDLDNLVLAGHSYGATGALQSLGHAPSLQVPAVGGIILDPGKQSGPLNADIKVPVLLVHSNSWSKKHSIFFGRPHFDTVRDLALHVLNRTGAAWFLTSLGTSHPSVSDAPLLEPLLLSLVTGARLDSREALAQYVDVSHDFVQFLISNKTRGVLAQGVTHPEYDTWLSTERQESISPQLSRLWQIHVSPASPGQDKETNETQSSS